VERLHRTLDGLLAMLNRTLEVADRALDESGNRCVGVVDEPVQAVVDLLLASFSAFLDALDPVPYANNNAIVTAVGRGEVQVGLVNHYYNFRALDEEPDTPSANHAFAPGDPGATLIVTAAGIVEGSQQVDEATQLLDFLLGDRGQRYFADETFEYPLVPGVEPAGNVPPTEFGDVGSIDLDELEGGLERTRQLIADAGLES